MVPEHLVLGSWFTWSDCAESLPAALRMTHELCMIHARRSASKQPERQSSAIRARSKKCLTSETGHAPTISAPCARHTASQEAGSQSYSVLSTRRRGWSTFVCCEYRYDTRTRDVPTADAPSVRPTAWKEAGRQSPASKTCEEGDDQSPRKEMCPQPIHQVFTCFCTTAWKEAGRQSSASNTRRMGWSTPASGDGAHSRCIKFPSYGAEGNRKVSFYLEHANDGMVNVCNKSCAHSRCAEFPSDSGESGRKRSFCAAHATVPVTPRQGSSDHEERLKCGRDGLDADDTVRRAGAGKRRKNRAPSSANTTSPTGTGGTRATSEPDSFVSLM